MSGIECKVIACICGAAQLIEKGNVLLAYRQAEGETINERGAILMQIKNENIEIYDILHQATGLALLPAKVTRESLPVVMRQGYEAIIANDEKFTQEQLVLVIEHGNTAEELGAQWNTALLKDAHWPPSP